MYTISESLDSSKGYIEGLARSVQMSRGLASSNAQAFIGHVRYHTNNDPSSSKLFRAMTSNEVFWLTDTLIHGAYTGVNDPFHTWDVA